MLIYLPTIFSHKKSTIHVGKYTVRPMVVFDDGQKCWRANIFPGETKHLKDDLFVFCFTKGGLLL